MRRREFVKANAIGLLGTAAVGDGVRAAEGW